MLLGHMQIQIQAIGPPALKITQSTVAVSTRNRPPGCACCLLPCYTANAANRPPGLTGTAITYNIHSSKLPNHPGKQEESYYLFFLCQNVTRYQGAPGDLPATDQHYCNHTLEHILRKPPTYKRRWLHRVRFAIAQRKQEESRQRRITNFFHRAPHKRNDQDPPAHTVDPPTVTKPHNTRKPPQTTQRILTEFFRERAPNTRSTTTFQTPLSPSP